MIYPSDKVQDITISKSEKIVHRSSEGMFLTKDYSYSLTEKDVPEWQVKKKSLEMRLQIKKFLCNSQIFDGVKTIEEASKEIYLLEVDLEKFNEMFNKIYPLAENATYPAF